MAALKQLKRLGPGLAAAVMALIASILPVQSQAQVRPWLDQALLAAAKKEGNVVVYSSINEQEGLPLFKLFEEATGIKVQYVRAPDAQLMARMMLEFRTKQRSYDIVFFSSAHKLPSQMLTQFDPSEAKSIAAEARDPNKRWYGVYTIYMTPAYNAQKVNRSELPRSYEDFAQRREWSGRVAIDRSDNEWIAAMFRNYGEQKATALIKELVSTLNPILTDGRLAMARAVGSGEYLFALNNFVNLSLNAKFAGAPVEIFALDPVALTFGQVAISNNPSNPSAARLAANFLLSEQSQQFLATFGRLPTRSNIETNPPGIVDALKSRKVVAVLNSAEEDKKWQQTFDTFFRRR